MDKPSVLRIQSLFHTVSIPAFAEKCNTAGLAVASVKKWKLVPIQNERHIPRAHLFTQIFAKTQCEKWMQMTFRLRKRAKI